MAESEPVQQLDPSDVATIDIVADQIEATIKSILLDCIIQLTRVDYSVRIAEFAFANESQPPERRDKLAAVLQDSRRAAALLSAKFAALWRREAMWEAEEAMIRIKRAFPDAAIDAETIVWEGLEAVIAQLHARMKAISDRHLDRVTK